LLWADEPSRSAVPFWQLAPFDRVTLSNGNKHDVDPIRIPAGTDLSAVADDEYVGRPGLPPRTEIRRPVRYRVRRQADGQDYEIYGRHIDKIELYEDLLLQQARKLLREDQFDASYRYLEALTRRAPDWPGLAELRVDFHHREAVRLKVAGQWENAFWEFVEAEKELGRLPAPVELSPSIDSQVDDLVDRWMADLIERKNLREARRVIARVKQARPSTPAIIRREEQLSGEAGDFRERGKKAAEEGRADEAIDLLESAVERLPGDEETRSLLETLFESAGHLRIGVERLPTFIGGPAHWTPADLRAIDILHQRIVIELVERGESRFQSKLLASIQRPDEFLNRRVVMEIAPNHRWPGTSKPVSIVDIHRLLTETCRPESPFYHPALARLVVAMKTESPGRLTIDFERPQPRPEIWLTLPLVQVSKGTEAGWSGVGPFVVERLSENEVRYRRNSDFLVPQRPIIKRVTERIIPRAADRLRALADQQIDLALDIPPRQWANAGQIPQTRLIVRSTPTVYLLQFNYNQRFLRDRTVRRAIRYALDVQRMLARLGMENPEVQRPTAVWPAGSFGYDSTIEPAAADLVLAKTLLEAAKKKFGSTPTLRLSHSGNEADRLACEEIAATLGRVGLKVNVVPFDGKSSASATFTDLRYVGLTVNDPVFDVMTLLTRDNPTLAEFAGPWLRQMLVDLVDVPNQSAARDLLPRLHRVLYEDVSVLPLWQYRERWLVSNRVTGPAEKIDRPYENVEDWKLRPGFPPNVGESTTTESKVAATPN
jgi:hypothetical protein